MSIRNIEILMYNPLFLSNIIQCFITGYEKEVDLKTLFYVLPVVMYKDSRNELNRARANSTLYSIFAKDDNFEEYGTKLNTKFCLNQITDMFNEYVGITKQTVIVLANQNKIIFNGKISLNQEFHYNKSPAEIREYFKAAYYFGKILKSIELVEFESFLGIKLGA